ncbi:hypothetical protein BaRGS_00000111 [Batillaria attramentaria]|uniref:Uncharacterized protein n=1 Tax=Batillaria attramentaria TaxID=370345 RepID=A0ABD0MB14_9CAEN
MSVRDWPEGLSVSTGLVSSSAPLPGKAAVNVSRVSREKLAETKNSRSSWTTVFGLRGRVCQNYARDCRGV